VGRQVFRAAAVHRKKAVIGRRVRRRCRRLILSPSKREKRREEGTCLGAIGEIDGKGREKLEKKGPAPLERKIGNGRDSRKVKHFGKEGRRGAARDRMRFKKKRKKKKEKINKKEK